MEYRKLTPYKYQLTKDEKYFMGNIYPTVPFDDEYMSLSLSGILTVKKGYAWDGATGGIETHVIRRASLIHDAYCQLIEKGCIPISFRLNVDIVFRRICKEDGMSWLRTWYTYTAIRAFVKWTYGWRF